MGLYDDAKAKRAVEFAFAEKKRLGPDPRNLPPELQAVVLVIAADGIIGNGGIWYYFESNFRPAVPYSFTVDSYRRIGAKKQAAAFEKAMALFKFKHPHLASAKRRVALDVQAAAFSKLNQVLSDHETVDRCLLEYIQANSKTFRDKR